MNKTSAIAGGALVTLALAISAGPANALLITGNGQTTQVVEGQPAFLQYVVTNDTGGPATINTTLSHQPDDWKLKLVDGEEDDNLKLTDITGCNQGVVIPAGKTCTVLFSFTTPVTPDDIPEDLDFGKWELTIGSSGANKIKPNPAARPDVSVTSGFIIVRDVGVPPIVPEPGSLLLLGTGIAGLVGYGWRRKG